jgi:hypothetical protein
MMRVLLDANVVLDVLLERQPFATEAQQIWDASDEGRFDGCIAAFSIPTIFYICCRQQGIEAASRASISVSKHSKLPRFTASAFWRREGCLGVISRTIFKSRAPSPTSCKES